MVSVGIDVSKGKSTVCMMKPYGEVIAGPMEIDHVDPELVALVKIIKNLNDEVKVVIPGKSVGGLPSTIIDLTGEEIKLIRQGPISLEDIKKAL